MALVNDTFLAVHVMKPKRYMAKMTMNPSYVSGNDSIDTFPMLVGELIGPRAGVNGVVVWWNRYRMSGVVREAVIYPLIGIQIGKDRWRLDVAPSADHKRLIGNWSVHGWNAEISIRPRGRGDEMNADVEILVHDRRYITPVSDETLPTEYFFPPNPQYVPRARQARLP